LGYDTVDLDLNPASEAKLQPKSLYRKLAAKMSSLMGLS
jgi:hypothetical protein